MQSSSVGSWWKLTISLSSALPSHNCCMLLLSSYPDSRSHQRGSKLCHWSQSCPFQSILTFNFNGRFITLKPLCLNMEAYNSISAFYDHRVDVQDQACDRCISKYACTVHTSLIDCCDNNNIYIRLDIRRRLIATESIAREPGRESDGLGALMIRRCLGLISWTNESERGRIRVKLVKELCL